MHAPDTPAIPKIEPLTIGDSRNADLHRSQLFSSEFDAAILGATINEHGCRVPGAGCRVPGAGL
jgi:hypothetical protein